jgi:lycopene beta-cyclase
VAMARGKRDGLLIAGGGLAGSLAAIAMARGRPEVPLLLVEEAESFGGADRLWCFLEDEVSEAGQELIQPLIAHRWPGYYVAFPGQSRKFKAGVAAIRTADVDRMVRETLRPDQYRLGTKAVAVRDNELVLLGGEKIKADGAIDARGAANLSMLDLGWRKSLARDYLFSAPHQVDRPVLIDATVDQYDGYRFMQCIPFSERRMRIEDSYLSDTPEIDLEASGARLDAYLAKRRWTPLETEREETNALPVALGGDFGAFWRVGGARVAKFGLRGGFFHPWSGSTLPDAVRTAMLLATQREFEGAALHDLFEREANTLWRNREFYRSFNSAVFKAGPDRRRILEELYHSDPALISRFHSETTGMLDRMRLGKLGR